MPLPTHPADRNQPNLPTSLDICLEYLVNEAERAGLFEVADVIRTARHNVARLTATSQADIQLTKH